MIIQCILPSRKAGASWVRTSKTTSRPRQEEPLMALGYSERQRNSSGGRPAGEAQCPSEGASQAGYGQREPKGKRPKAGIGWVVYNPPKLGALIIH